MERATAKATELTSCPKVPRFLWNLRKETVHLLLVSPSGPSGSTHIITAFLVVVGGLGCDVIAGDLKVVGSGLM